MTVTLLLARERGLSSKAEVVRAFSDESDALRVRERCNSLSIQITCETDEAIRGILLRELKEADRTVLDWWHPRIYHLQTLTVE